jgi:hypothetical protein
MTAPALSVSTNNGRYYIHPKRRKSVPSITNIKDVKSIPALKYVAARDAAGYAADNRAKLATLDRNEAFQLVKQAPFTFTDESPARIGDVVHDWIDRYIKGAPPGAQEINGAVITARHMWQRFGEFVGRYQPQFVDSEFTVWSDTHDYAGTGDLAMNIKGALILADTKTGKNVYPETGMQLAALAFADCILTTEGEEKPIPKFDRFAVLHLRPTSYQLIPVDNIEASFRAFLGLKAVFDWEVEYGDKTLGFSPRVGTRERQAA